MICRDFTATALLLGMLALAACGDANEASRIVGQLESDRVELTVEFAEPIIERLVREGEPVAAGQTILRQDDARIRARVAEAVAALAQNRARLDELTRGPRKEQIQAIRANVAGAERDLEFRKIEYDRALKVEERQLASPESRDRAKAALDAAQAALAFQQARLSELLTGTTVEELRQAESALQQAEARLSALEVDAGRHTTVAPVDGIVDSLPYETGERPGVGQPAAILLGGSQPYARAYVPEGLRSSVAPGMPARVYVDGIAEPFDGSVRWVASEATFTPYFALTQHDRGRLSFVAKIDLVTAGDRLPDGVPVEVEFVAPAASR